MKNICQLMFLMISMALSPLAGAVPQIVGSVVSTTIAADRVDVGLDDGTVGRVEFLSSDIVRVRFNATGTFSSRTTGAIAANGLTAPGAAVVEFGDGILMLSDDLLVVVLKAPLKLLILRPDGTPVMLDEDQAIGWDDETGLIYTRKSAPVGEHYFGMGERGGPMDRRGRKFTMFNQDAGAYHEFTDMLYQSFPFYYGMNDGQAYGVFLDNAASPFFDFDSTGSGEVYFGALAGELDYYVMAGPGVPTIANRYAQLTGVTPLPPLWTLGYHQARFGYATQQEYLDIANEFRSRGIPCDALYYDLQYEDALQIFTWDPVAFPDPVGMNATLHGMGFETVNITEPAVHIFDGLWAFLDANEFFIKNTDTGQSEVNNIFIGDVSWLDFSRTEVKDWYRDTLRLFLSTGISGLWDDLNEPAQNDMPNTIWDFDGDPRTDLEARNLVALLQTELSYQALRELRPDKRPYVLARSGYSGIQRYAANWSGDTLSSFDSLRTSVQMSNHMGLSGQNFFGHDIGGWLETPTDELFVRWMQFSLYNAIFRNHSNISTARREPWVFPEPYQSIVIEHIEQRYRMLPYIYSLMAEAEQTGRPPVAPTLYYFQQDTRTWDQDTEFMFGPSLLVAPVLEAGAIERTLYLPAGADWYDLYTDQKYSGGQDVTVPVTLEHIPVFVRAGSILPGGPVKQHVDDDVPPLLTMDHYPGGINVSQTLYEDAGDGYAYQTGEFRETDTVVAENSSVSSLVVWQRSGNWVPPSRPVMLTLHDRPVSPSSVQKIIPATALVEVADAVALAAASEGWFYDAAKRQVVVKFVDNNESNQALDISY